VIIELVLGKVRGRSHMGDLGTDRFREIRFKNVVRDMVQWQAFVT
jgi:hypothetical protein